MSENPEIVEIGPLEWDMKVLWLDTDQLVPNASNPNEQDDATFNALVDSITRDGWTQPVQAVQIAESMYEIVAGEHRWRAAKVLQSKVPVIPLPAGEFHEDRREWALVKDNMLHGKLNPAKFASLYERLTQRYDADVMKTLMGFTTEDAFKKVYQKTREGLPPELQSAMDSAKDEIRTIDDLSRVLNRLFQEHGETLPSNFMVFSYGGKEVMWVRADRELWQTVSRLGKEAENYGLDLAAVIGEALRPLKLERPARAEAPALPVDKSTAAPEFSEAPVS